MRMRRRREYKENPLAPASLSREREVIFCPHSTVFMGRENPEKKDVIKSNPLCHDWTCWLLYTLEMARKNYLCTENMTTSSDPTNQQICDFWLWSSSHADSVCAAGLSEWFWADAGLVCNFRHFFDGDRGPHTVQISSLKLAELALGLDQTGKIELDLFQVCDKTETTPIQKLTWLNHAWLQWLNAK